MITCRLVGAREIPRDLRPVLWTQNLLFFIFNDTATTEIYTLSLHDALPISPAGQRRTSCRSRRTTSAAPWERRDRKSTRLNSSHEWISYAVFCLKKKKI